MVVIITKTMSELKTYSELIKLETFKERYEYLKLDGIIGLETFGFERYLNQEFYRSKLWKQIRRDVIVRDLGKDLGILDVGKTTRLLVHHMNPVTITDIRYQTDLLINPEYLISVTHKTHNAIHYGYKEYIAFEYIERKPGDTCLW